MVALPDTRDCDVDAMADYCAERAFVLRLIETMPMGDSGRRAGFRDLQPIKERLRNRFGLVDGLVPGNGPAHYLVSRDGSIQIGFITPISQHFCATCNRVRLAVDGTLHLCLGQENTVDLRGVMREGCSDKDLQTTLVAALLKKPERHEFRERPGQILRVMSSTGG
jgi:cyclic pyranopterin phosphate synthase